MRIRRGEDSRPSLPGGTTSKRGCRFREFDLGLGKSVGLKIESG